MSTLLAILSWPVLLAGAFFAVTSVVGLWRMPDFYTRIHGSGCLDSIASGLILLGLAMQANSWIDVGKYVLLYLLILVSSPVIAHAMARTARQEGVPPRQSGVAK